MYLYEWKKGKEEEENKKSLKLSNKLLPHYHREKKRPKSMPITIALIMPLYVYSI